MRIFMHIIRYQWPLSHEKKVERVVYFNILGLNNDNYKASFFWKGILEAINYRQKVIIVLKKRNFEPSHLKIHSLVVDSPLQSTIPSLLLSSFFLLFLNWQAFILVSLLGMKILQITLCGRKRAYIVILPRVKFFSALPQIGN